jgi:hypothetical protein
MTSDDGATGVSHVQPGGDARLSTRKVEVVVPLDKSPALQLKTGFESFGL